MTAPLASDAAVDDPLKVEDLASKKSAGQEARKAHLLLQPHFLSPTPKCAPAARKSHQGRRFRLLRPLNWTTTLSVWLSKKANLLLGRWRCRCGREDRKSVVEGKGVSVVVELVGCGVIKKKIKQESK